MWVHLTNNGSYDLIKYDGEHFYLNSVGVNYVAVQLAGADLTTFSNIKLQIKYSDNSYSPQLEMVRQERTYPYETNVIWTNGNNYYVAVYNFNVAGVLLQPRNGAVALSVALHDAHDGRQARDLARREEARLPNLLRRHHRHGRDGRAACRVCLYAEGDCARLHSGQRAPSDRRNAAGRQGHPRPRARHRFRRAPSARESLDAAQVRRRTPRHVGRDGGEVHLRRHVGGHRGSAAHHAGRRLRRRPRACPPRWLFRQRKDSRLLTTSILFKSGDPAKRAAAIVQAVTNWQDAKLLAKLSENLGPAMVGINADEIETIMEERGK